MEKSEDIANVKVESGSPPRPEPADGAVLPELSDTHLYPDWATMQALYSQGVPLHQPVFEPGVSDYHFPPHACVWTPPQTMIPFYGLPYTVYYSQGPVFAHPAAPLVSSSSTDSVSKSLYKTDQCSPKKLRRLDGIDVPVGNDRAEFDREASDHEVSQSTGIGASNDGSDGNDGVPQSMRRSNSTEPRGKDNVAVGITPQYCSEAPIESELLTQNSVHMPNGKAEPSVVCADEGLPSEVRLQEERRLKIEKRKLSNRESAQRSRLKKQAVIDELMARYEALKVENLALKSEVILLTQDSEKVKFENAALMKKLEKAGADETKLKTTRPKNSDELLKLNNLCSVRVKEEKADA